MRAATVLERGPALLAILVLAACGGGETGGEAGEEMGGEEMEGEAAAPVVDPAEAATITGTISFEGEPPAAEAIDMSEEPTCAEAYGADGPMTQHVVVADGRLGNVYVYVKEGISQEFPTPSEAVTLDQQHCRYRPHVLGLQTGQPLRITNSDDILHNINAQPQDNRGFNISQPQAGMETTRDFARPEVMIPVKCDVHGWMNAYIGVDAHPFHAVSAEDGTFEISGLPPGDYVVEAWHERYGTQTMNVSVDAAGTAQADFTYSADMAGRPVPMGEPLIISHTEDGGLTATRPSETGAGR